MVSGPSLELSQLRDTRSVGFCRVSLLGFSLLDLDILCIQQGYDVEFRGSGAFRIAVVVAVEL